MTTATLTVGVISDTHGLLRPEAVAALAGVDQILHAGDVGTPDILTALKAIAPTTAVRGNVDHGVWATALPMTDVIRLGDLDVFMLHDLGALDLDPVVAGFAAVITGHSHQPKAEWKRGVLYLNPGSAGPRRFTLPVTLSILRIIGGTIAHERIDLLG
ncbi:MAG: metallophosphoesterase family protein [Acidobacteria bacterium]|nr:metallophosphoesterase family protein [Acidobacteriota bacterium]